jgi:O-antigen/teichoic acid export membrane protein
VHAARLSSSAVAADTPPARIEALIGLLVMGGIGIALVPSKAQGESIAYLACGIAFIVSLVISAVVERRLHLSRRDRKLVAGEITVIVSLVLIVVLLDAPILETAILGALVGAVIGAGSMIYLETIRGSRPRR